MVEVLFVGGAALVGGARSAPSVSASPRAPCSVGSQRWGRCGGRATHRSAVALALRKKQACVWMQQQSEDGDSGVVIDVDAKVGEYSLEQLKQRFVLATADTNRGFAADAARQKVIMQMIEELEARSTSATPLDDALFLGEWSLIYTNSLDVLSLGLLAPVAGLGRIFQNVERAATGAQHEFDIFNIVELEPPFQVVLSPLGLGPTRSVLRVEAEGSRGDQDDQLLNLRFMRSNLTAASIAGMKLQLPKLSASLGGQAVGYVRTTFLDEDLRFARSAPTRFNENGTLFCLKRCTTDTLLSDVQEWFVSKRSHQGALIYCRLESILTDVAVFSSMRFIDRLRDLFVGRGFAGFLAHTLHGGVGVTKRNESDILGKDASSILPRPWLCLVF
ncbi:Plastid lipid-associated protein 1, chloroplastic [Porphyridium purpureum]|uniref:Plastid lipid-associated protein 1, chloroplastic n=1 Tax=Porphyridium purpureum TaxID=35688 RepID=A0A5J4YK43_PORPP|nr:Plastid lipid-associated protein 1, chloroplastic [Porphyridium purpureum]|eukprot:POR1881..scf291_13